MHSLSSPQNIGTVRRGTPAYTSARERAPGALGFLGKSFENVIEAGTAASTKPLRSFHVG